LIESQESRSGVHGHLDVLPEIEEIDEISKSSSIKNTEFKNSVAGKVDFYNQR